MEDKRQQEGANVFELRLSQPYSEFDFSSEERPSDDHSFKKSLNEELPFPCKFKRNQPEEVPSCRHGVMISLINPHAVLAASDGFLEMTGFCSSQVCGRSINTVFGPKTNTSEILAAIKNTSRLETTELNTVLYTSSGREIDLCAAVSPLYGKSGDCLRGCLLRINFINCAGRDAGSPILILEDFTCASTSDTPPLLKNESQRWRREANLMTGMENDAERRRQLLRRGCV